MRVPITVNRPAGSFGSMNRSPAQHGCFRTDAIDVGPAICFKSRSFTGPFLRAKRFCVRRKRSADATEYLFSAHQSSAITRIMPRNELIYLTENRFPQPCRGPAFLKREFHDSIPAPRRALGADPSQWAYQIADLPNKFKKDGFHGSSHPFIRPERARRSCSVDAMRQISLATLRGVRGMQPRCTRMNSVHNSLSTDDTMGTDARQNRVCLN